MVNSAVSRLTGSRVTTIGKSTAGLSVASQYLHKDLNQS